MPQKPEPTDRAASSWAPCGSRTRIGATRLSNDTGLATFPARSRTRPRPSPSFPQQQLQGTGRHLPRTGAAQCAGHHHRHRRRRHADRRPVQDPRLRRQGRCLCRRLARFRRLHPRQLRLSGSAGPERPVRHDVRPRHHRRRHQHRLQDARSSTTSTAPTPMSATATITARSPTSTSRSTITTAIRLNLMGNVNHVVDRDLIYSDRWGARPVAFGLGTDTQLILNYLHQDDNRIPDYGIPVAQAPGELMMHPASEYGVPRNTFLGYNTDRDETHADMFTERCRIRQRLADADQRYPRRILFALFPIHDDRSLRCDCRHRILLDAAVRRQSRKRPMAASAAAGPIPCAPGALQNISTARADFDLGISAPKRSPVSTCPIRTTRRAFIITRCRRRATFTYLLGNNTATRANIGRNLFAPDHNPPPNYAPFLYNAAGLTCPAQPMHVERARHDGDGDLVRRTDGDSTDLGAFPHRPLWFTDQWSVIGGIRFDRYNSEFTNFLINGTASLLKSESSSGLAAREPGVRTGHDQDILFHLGPLGAPARRHRRRRRDCHCVDHQGSRTGNQRILRGWARNTASSMDVWPSPARSSREEKNNATADRSRHRISRWPNRARSRRCRASNLGLPASSSTI